MEAKKIVKGMSPTPWQIGDFCLNIEDEHAATIAVNNTYGKGLNPEVYEDVVKALEFYVEMEKSSMRYANENNIPYMKSENFHPASGALKKARI
jgi:hypothetical protein